MESSVPWGWLKPGARARRELFFRVWTERGADGLQDREEGTRSQAVLPVWVWVTISIRHLPRPVCAYAPCGRGVGLPTSPAPTGLSARPPVGRAPGRLLTLLSFPSYLDAGGGGVEELISPGYHHKLSTHCSAHSQHVKFLLDTSEKCPLHVRPLIAARPPLLSEAAAAT